MTLGSNLLRDNERLAACETTDAAHVVLGERGEHVRLIQIALKAIDGYAIAATELANRQYGPSTANAVLAYKKKRNVINRSYQSSPDNVVGKMTIVSLDRDMLARQYTPRPITPVRCRRRHRVVERPPQYAADAPNRNSARR